MFFFHNVIYFLYNTQLALRDDKSNQQSITQTNRLFGILKII